MPPSPEPHAYSSPRVLTASTCIDAESCAIGVSISRDGGDTFGEVTYDRTLIGPVCQASIVSFNGATYFSNPADAHGRDKITIRRSQDNAVTWESSLLVHGGKTFGYSCLVKGALLKRGGGQSGGILFESAKETVAFAEFSLGF